MLISITRSNYDIDHILPNVKLVVYIHYVTNFATKKDYHQHQDVIDDVLVQNAQKS